MGQANLQIWLPEISVWTQQDWSGVEVLWSPGQKLYTSFNTLVFSPPHPWLLSLRVIWSHSTKHHFFFFFGGPGGGGVELHSMVDLSSPIKEWFPALCSGSLEDSPLDHQQSPCLSPKYLRFASFGRICTQSHSYYNDDDLAIVIQTFLINYYCLLLLENFSFWKYLQPMRREFLQTRNLFASWKISLKPSFQLKWLSSSPIHSLTAHNMAAVPMLGYRKTNATWPLPSKFII